MAATGEPRPPEPDPDDLEAVARSLNWELKRLHRLRRWKISAMAALAAAFIAVSILFGAEIYSEQQVASCVNTYAQRNAQVQRARALANQEANRALSRLVGETLHLRGGGDYRMAVRDYQAQVAKANRVPIPPLPPAACR